MCVYRRDADCACECVVDAALEVGVGVDAVEHCGDLGVAGRVERVGLRADTGRVRAPPKREEEEDPVDEHGT